jgi:hypothetical protein
MPEPRQYRKGLHLIRAMTPTLTEQELRAEDECNRAMRSLAQEVRRAGWILDDMLWECRVRGDTRFAFEYAVDPEWYERVRQLADEAERLASEAPRMVRRA